MDQGNACGPSRRQDFLIFQNGRITRALNYPIRKRYGLIELEGNMLNENG